MPRQAPAPDAADRKLAHPEDEDRGVGPGTPAPHALRALTRGEVLGALATPGGIQEPGKLGKGGQPGP